MVAHNDFLDGGVSAFRHDRAIGPVADDERTKCQFHGDAFYPQYPQGVVDKGFTVRERRYRIDSLGVGITDGDGEYRGAGTQRRAE